MALIWYVKQYLLSEVKGYAEDLSIARDAPSTCQKNGANVFAAQSPKGIGDNTIENSFNGKNPELERLLLLFVQHVTVFEALRELSITDKDPIDVGVPWPTDIFPVLWRETKKQQERFAKYIDQSGDYS